MESERIDARQAMSESRLPRRTVTGGLAGGGALAALVAALGARPTRVAAQEATPETIAGFEDLGLTVGPLFSTVVEDLPSAPVEMSLARVTSQPGDGDLDDYFTFPGPVLFIVESGQIICAAGPPRNPTSFCVRRAPTSRLPQYRRISYSVLVKGSTSRPIPSTRSSTPARIRRSSFFFQAEDGI